jgi:hypothetical protein
MPKSDMHQAYIRSLMYLIGGVPRANETARWIENLSKTTGIGARSLQAAYSGQWISKNKYVSDRTLEILEQAAANARQTQDLVAFTELQIAIWETAPELFQANIAMARDFVDRLRRYDAERGKLNVPTRDGAAAAAEAAGFPAAKATATS